MKNIQPTPPQLAKLLLTIILPEHVKNEISGDLEEEFHQFIRAGKTENIANRWFWEQTMSTTFRYLFTKQRILSAVLILIALSTIVILFIAVTALSYGNIAFFNNDFWSNGNIHLIFFEEKFWRFGTEKAFSYIYPNHLIDLNSAIYSVIALLMLFTLAKKFQFKLLTLSMLSLVLLLAPYIYGFALFQLASLTNKEIGPLIAFMWLPIMYMVLPITYLLIKKINRVQVFQ